MRTTLALNGLNFMITSLFFMFQEKNSQNFIVICLKELSYFATICVESLIYAFLYFSFVHLHEAQEAETLIESSLFNFDRFEQPLTKQVTVCVL